MPNLSPELMFQASEEGLLPYLSSSFPFAFGLLCLFLGDRRRGLKRGIFYFFGLCLFVAGSFHFSSWRLLFFAALKALAKLLEIEPSPIWLLLWSLGLAALFAEARWLSIALVCSACLGARWSWDNGFRVLVPGLIWLFCLPASFGMSPIFNLYSPFLSWILYPLFGFCITLPTAFAKLFTLLRLYRGAAIWENFANTLLLKLLNFIPSFSLWVDRRLCCVCFFALFPMLFLTKKRYWIVLSPLLVLPTLWQAKSGAVILDVGQGDSILLYTKERPPFLVDAGPGAKFSSIAPSEKRLEANAVAELDGLLITHPDFDHYGGLDSLLTRHPVLNGVWLHPLLLASPKAMKVLRLLERHGASIHLLGSESSPYPGLQCRLSPARNANEISPLCRFTREDGKTLLLTGDMDEKNEEYYLRSDPGFLTANALKVAHHGSKTSSSTPFLRTSAVKIAFISVGKRNPFHHPNPATLARLHGIEVHRTDQEGDLPWLE